MMEELTKALGIVLVVTISLGIPVAMLFVVGCLIQYRHVLSRFASRLMGRAEEKKGETPSA